MVSGEAFGSGLQLMPAFTSGLADALSPGGLTNLLIFIIFLSWIGSTTARISVWGVVYLLVSVWIHFLSVQGHWDSLLAKEGALETITAIYLVAAAVFLAIGILEIRVWWHFKKQGQLNTSHLKLPAFFKGQEQPVDNRSQPALLFLRNFVSAAAVGGSTALLSTMYPQSEYIFIVHSFWLSGGDIGFVHNSFLVYSCAMVMWMAVAWIVICIIRKMNLHDVKMIVYFKGILSAVYIATALGTVYYFLNQG